MNKAIFIAGLLMASATAIGAQLLLHRHNQSMLEEMGENKESFETLFSRIQKETPYWVLVTSGYRSNAEQERLYARNKKNAKPGSSPHQHRRAMDINLVSIRGFVRKSDSKETWEETGAPGIARGLGFRWGGDFKYYHDPVHFEVRRSR